MIIYNTYPPEVYGNLKTLCDDLKVSYSTYSKKDFSLIINGVEVFKVVVKRGGEKKKEKKKT